MLRNHSSPKGIILAIEIHMKAATNVHDRAYGSFLFCGIGALWFALTSPPSGTEGLFVAAVSTIVLWRHWPILGPTALTAVFVYVEAMYSDAGGYPPAQVTQALREVNFELQRSPR